MFSELEDCAADLDRLTETLTADDRLARVARIRAALHAGAARANELRCTGPTDMQRRTTLYQGLLAAERLVARLSDSA